MFDLFNYVVMGDFYFFCCFVGFRERDFYGFCVDFYFFCFLVIRRRLNVLSRLRWRLVFCLFCEVAVVWSACFRRGGSLGFRLGFRVFRGFSGFG